MNKNYDVHVPELKPRIVFRGANAGQITDWGHKFLNVEALHELTLGENSLHFILDTADSFVHPDLVDNARNDLGANFTGEIGDLGGHGHPVASVICMADNAFGGKGVCPKGKAVPVKVLSKGGGTYDWVYSGIRHSADVVVPEEMKGMQRIINMSLSGKSDSVKIREAIAYAISKNCIVTCAGGNYGLESGKETIGFPAMIDEVLATAAIKDNGAPSSFSANGKAIDYGMPGQNVYVATYPDGYASYDGSSFACPYLSGVIGLITSALPEINNQKKITDYLESMAVDIHVKGKDDRTGYGTIDCALIAEDIKRRRAVVSSPTLFDALKDIFPDEKSMKKLNEPQLLKIGKYVGANTDKELTRAKNREEIGKVLY